jgi:hypothetical protein
MTGLAPKTLEVFEEAARLSCIRDFVLVGGTALSLQINHRLSADLDFCKWVNVSNARNGIPYLDIEKELKGSFSAVQTNPIDFDQCDYLVNNEVKFQFFNEVGYSLPSRNSIPLKGNIRIAPILTIGAMKIKTMFQRNAYRDYYDVFAIVKDGHLTFKALLAAGCAYNLKLNTKMVINRLTSHESFHEEEEFGLLTPRYQISSREIGEFFTNETTNLFR